MNTLLFTLLLFAPGEVVGRAEHWTDTVAATPGVQTRKIQNDINYTEDGTTFAPSEDDAVQGSFTLAGDTYAFRKRSRLFFYADKASGNRMAAAVRSSRDPNCWLKIELVGASAGAPTVVDGQTLRYDFHANGSYFLRAGRKRLEKIVRVTGNIGQNYIEYDYKTPETVTVQSNDAGWRLNCGDVHYDVYKALTWDSANGSIAGIDGQPIATTTTVESNTVTGGIRTVRLRVAPNSAAVSASLALGRVVFIDPTTTISGGGSIIDNAQLVPPSGADFNYGTTTTFGSATQRWQMIRVTSGLPAGTISAARLYLTATASGGNKKRLYKVAGNPGWIEGTKNGTTAGTGEPCLNWFGYNTVAWASGGEFGSSTADYVASPYYEYAGSIVANTPYATDFDASIVVEWRDGTGDGNGGLAIKNASGATGTHNTTEAASYQPYFEVDTVAGSGGFRFGKIL